MLALSCMHRYAMGMATAPSSRPSFPSGSLDLVLLSLIARQATHGYRLARLIEEVSDGRLAVEEGSLYPSLQRLKKRKLVEQGTHRQLRSAGGLYAQLADLQERGLARQLDSLLDDSGVMMAVMDAHGHVQNASSALLPTQGRSFAAKNLALSLGALRPFAGRAAGTAGWGFHTSRE